MAGWFCSKMHIQNLALGPRPYSVCKTIKRFSVGGAALILSSMTILGSVSLSSMNEKEIRQAQIIKYVFQKIHINLLINFSGLRYPAKVWAKFLLKRVRKWPQQFASMLNSVSSWPSFQSRWIQSLIFVSRRFEKDLNQSSCHTYIKLCGWEDTNFCS